MGLEESIHVKVDSETKKILTELAEEDGRDLSSYVRHFLTRLTKMERPALIALTEILRTGSDEEKAKQYAHFIVFQKDEIEWDRLAARKIKNLVRGNDD